MAMNGLVPVVEMQFDAFAYPAFEQITSHLAKLRNRTRGHVALPVHEGIYNNGGNDFSFGAGDEHNDAVDL